MRKSSAKPSTKSAADYWQHASKAAAWELSAPETYLILHGVDAAPAEVLKAAFRELFARGALSVSAIDQRSAAGGILRRYVLKGGPRRRQVRRPLFELIEVYDAMPAIRLDPVKAPPVQLTEFMTAISKQLGGAEGYRKIAVEALVARGLARHKRGPLGLGRERDALTPAGEKARGELEERFQAVNQMPDWARGIAFAGLLGSAVVLVEDAYPVLQTLREQFGSALATGGNGTDPEKVKAEAEAKSFKLPESFELLGLPSGGAAVPAVLPTHAAPKPTGAPKIDLGSFSFELDLGRLDGVEPALQALEASIAG